MSKEKTPIQTAIDLAKSKINDIEYSMSLLNSDGSVYDQLNQTRVTLSNFIDDLKSIRDNQEKEALIEARKQFHPMLQDREELEQWYNEKYGDE